LYGGKAHIAYTELVPYLAVSKSKGNYLQASNISVEHGFNFMLAIRSSSFKQYVSNCRNFVLFFKNEVLLGSVAVLINALSRDNLLPKHNATKLYLVSFKPIALVSYFKIKKKKNT